MHIIIIFFLIIRLFEYICLKKRKKKRRSLFETNYWKERKKKKKKGTKAQLGPGPGRSEPGRAGLFPTEDGTVNTVGMLISLRRRASRCRSAAMLE